jgi:hypothetical protein
MLFRQTFRSPSIPPPFLPLLIQPTSYSDFSLLPHFSSLWCPISLASPFEISLSSSYSAIASLPNFYISIYIRSRFPSALVVWKLPEYRQIIVGVIYHQINGLELWGRYFQKTLVSSCDLLLETSSAIRKIIKANRAVCSWSNHQ